MGIHRCKELVLHTQTSCFIHWETTVSIASNGSYSHSTYVACFHFSGYSEAFTFLSAVSSCVYVYVWEGKRQINAETKE